MRRVGAGKQQSPTTGNSEVKRGVVTLFNNNNNNNRDDDDDDGDDDAIIWYGTIPYLSLGLRTHHYHTPDAEKVRPPNLLPGERSHSHGQTMSSPRKRKRDFFSPSHTRPPHGIITLLVASLEGCHHLDCRGCGRGPWGTAGGGLHAPDLFPHPPFHHPVQWRRMRVVAHGVGTGHTGGTVASRRCATTIPPSRMGGGGGCPKGRRKGSGHDDDDDNNNKSQQHATAAATTTTTTPQILGNVYPGWEYLAGSSFADPGQSLFAIHGPNDGTGPRKTQPPECGQGWQY
eukprot:scaffold2194_cov138-Amphora_coffeaeformis.AAC.3